MSCIGNISEKECQNTEFQRKLNLSGLVTKLTAQKISADPNWNKEDDFHSDVSTTDKFLTKGAFLLTPSYELSIERAAVICEKMSIKGYFSLTKTATGILFKFSHPDDYQSVIKKGFHKVTGARFYRKIAIPCRPRKTFTLYALEVPEDLPVEDLRHALYKFDSVVEVVRIHLNTQSPASPTEKSVDETGRSERPERKVLPLAVIRITLASVDEYNILLQNGLNFYDATFFPTDANITIKDAKIDYKRRYLEGNTPGRVRELLPVFDAAGFCKVAPPTSKLIKPPRS
ncbi:uncharacterized protein LOC119670334 [Teleopsis dalmanni]|uniref:uncharacterized protein LOC119670334 n=1 Tax=Teleopsis dalmanni TaxID=139649 RepID=UPI0018CF3B3A|nr:uncharacterized protein LOC119670334 [Teleopsis dalmanni]